MWTLLAILPVLIWLYLLLGRGAFWRAPVLQAHAEPSTSSTHAGTQIVAVIPARNEAELIAESVRSLLSQAFAGTLHLIVVDDGSSDATVPRALAAASALDAQARLTVIHGGALPPGWTGKLWAMAQGLELALRRSPDYVLFTDADIRHDSHQVAQLVGQAERSGSDLVSCMVTLSMQTLAEKWLMPAFVFFFFMLYPPHWVASRRRRTAAAAGGCMLVRSRALARIGGLAAIRGELIDDCALAQAIKRSGGAISLTLTRSAHSLRRYSLLEIGRLISRTAFNQLHHSYGLLIATLLGLVVTYVLSPALLLTHRAAVVGLGLCGWLMMAIAYLPMLRFYARNPLWSVSLPAISLFYAGATLHSAWQYARGRGGAWKGRAQDLGAGAA
jgi:hopene-associated glycosyltransferase HpnB